MIRGLHWFRNDLRLQDNTALLALQERIDAWLPVFVLDPRIYDEAQIDRPRTRFMLDCLERLGRDLKKRGVPLLVRAGRPEEVLPLLLQETRSQILSYNEDTTPFAKARDGRVRERIEAQGGEVLSRLDHVVFGSDEIRTGTGGPYSVYTPYRNTWWKHWKLEPRRPARAGKLASPIPGFAADAVPTPAEDPAFKLPTGGEDAAKRRLESFVNTGLEHYEQDRDRPAVDGTSRLSPYLRFGAISVRQCFERAEQAGKLDRRLRAGASKWLDELVWREFYSAILDAHPRVLRENFRREYDFVTWNDDPKEFQAWCRGETGYPIVDAGMRQLNSTGWMHNRVRMIVASFLTKDLLIDWRKGERYFFEHLVDADPASNNGGWQWAASTGTDAQPYFRIFNPVAQGQRWDPEGAYVRRWVPELAAVPDKFVHAPWQANCLTNYPPPVVDHAERRKLALERYGKARELAANG